MITLVGRKSLMEYHYNDKQYEATIVHIVLLLLFWDGQHQANMGMLMDLLVFIHVLMKINNQKPKN